MIINLKTLNQGRCTLAQDAVMSDEHVREGAIQGPVSCRGTLDVLHYQIHVAATFSCAVRATCSRCAEELSLPLHGEFRMILQHRDAPPGESAPADEVDFYYSDDDSEVDTRQTLYDEIMTAMPIMPLCSPDCRGVENDAVPRDRDDSIDPRWEALRKLKSSHH
ncbi:MAG: hypothetical protein GF418_06875 [Chitinivibrionales bacterium]|nr:hypothetical protein [Chitinivibrionales bacterium]MBD3395333.1 hypothetical protein [Chitinivibrionales bacterium]